MNWIPLAVLAAIFSSLEDVFKKYGLRVADEYAISFIMRMVSFIVLFPILFFIPIPHLSPGFFPVFIGSVLINSFVTVIYIKAIKYSDISLVIPLITFTPLFLLITSPIFLGEFPSALGLVGIICIVAGSYLSHLSHNTHGIFAPFKALFTEKGSRLMLLVAFLWSITSNFDKIGLRDSSPMFWIISVQAGSALIFAVILLFRKESFRQLKTTATAAIPAGIMNGFTSVAQILAVQAALVPYVISIKRSGTILVVLFGHFLFKEKHLQKRLSGVLLMVLGVVLIVLS